MSSKDVDFKIVDLILSTGTLSKESRNDPVFHECIHELSALPMYRLSSEPSYLRDCHRRVIEENYKLASDNYSTFIQTAECTKKIFTDFEVVEGQNEMLTEKIPDFVNSCNSFVEKCRKSISMANMNSLTLKNHNQILEILEIPQLLEACIRNNYLDEALEVIGHIRKLERRHHNVDIITNVARESRLAAQKLLDQLFQQLGGNLQLPACLKIVGYLRRMDCLPDSLLRLKFLQCRDNYLKNLLRSLPTNDPFFHATKHMEMTRINLFDIATQYKAVFNDEDIYIDNSQTDVLQQGMLFSSWLVMRLHSFMASFAEDLDLIMQNSVDYKHSSDVTHSSKTSSQSIGSKLQSLLGQSMYFGLSLSRIGSDFRGLLMPLFYQAITKYVQLRLDEIPDSFSDCISSYKWTLNIDNDEIWTLSRAASTTEELVRAQKSDEIIAPNQLMNHPLLAMLVNQILSILEDIRLCCPRVLRERICESFAGTLEQITICLIKFYQEEATNLSVKERQLFVSMVTAFVCCFLPHVNLCLTILFSPEPGRSTCQKHALDITKLGQNLITILPESFFLPSTTDEDSGVNHDVLHDSGAYEQGIHAEETQEKGRIDETDELNREQYAGDPDDSIPAIHPELGEQQHPDDGALNDETMLHSDGDKTPILTETSEPGLDEMELPRFDGCSLNDEEVGEKIINTIRDDIIDNAVEESTNNIVDAHLADLQTDPTIAGSDMSVTLGLIDNDEAEGICRRDCNIDSLITQSTIPGNSDHPDSHAITSTLVDDISADESDKSHSSNPPRAQSPI